MFLNNKIENPVILAFGMYYQIEIGVLWATVKAMIRQNGPLCIQDRIERKTMKDQSFGQLNDS